jgi:hypothetical protein
VSCKEMRRTSITTNFNTLWIAVVHQTRSRTKVIDAKKVTEMDVVKFWGDDASSLPPDGTMRSCDVNATEAPMGKMRRN